MTNNLQDKALSIDITDYWLILNKRIIQVMLVFTLVFLGVTFYTMRQSPVYEAESRIRIAARQPMATIEGAAITWYGAGPASSLNCEIELMTSKDTLLDTVLDILRKGEESRPLKRDHDGKTNPDREYYEDELPYIQTLNFTGDAKAFIDKLSIGQIRSGLKITPVNASDIVSISVSGGNPDVVKALANLIAIVYRADFCKTKTNDARDTKKFIQGRLDETKDDLDNLRGSMQKTGEENVFLGSLVKYQDELTSLRLELNKLKETYQDDHPRIIKQKKLIASVEEQLSKFPKTKQGYDDNIVLLELKQGMRKNLEEYFLKASIDYEAKKLKSKDEVQIIAKAVGTPRKLRPNKAMNMIVGALFGIIIGCVYAFIWEGLDTSIGKIEDVERITGLPVIAHIPMIGGGKAAKGTSFFKPLKMLFKMFYNVIPVSPPEEDRDIDKKILFNYDTLSMTAEAYRTLRTNIQFAIGTSKTTSNVICITSSSPREGKTLTSTNLSISLAQMGKTTLLIEADMRRPQIAGLFKINEKPGLSDVLIGTAKSQEAIKTFTDVLIGNAKWENLLETPGVDNLNIMPCGTLPPNPTELLLSNEFRELVEKERKKYDFVIIDTPPILPVSDSSIISTVCDGTVLIYQSDTTSRHLLLRAIQTLSKNQAKLIGIVINQLSFDVVLQSSRVKYKYGYSYGYGYSSKKE